jgi:hypothetical protein
MSVGLFAAIGLTNVIGRLGNLPTSSSCEYPSLKKRRTKMRQVRMHKIDFLIVGFMSISSFHFESHFFPNLINWTPALTLSDQGVKKKKLYRFGVIRLMDFVFLEDPQNILRGQIEIRG